jgi:predicted PurR-regulated permease PerM
MRKTLRRVPARRSVAGTCGYHARDHVQAVAPCGCVPMDHGANTDLAVEPTRGDGPSAPFWLLRVGALGWRLLVIVALVAVLGAIALTINTVTASIIVSILASAAVMPVMKALRGRGWRVSLSAAAATALVFGIVVVVLGVAAIVLVEYGPDLVKAIEAGLKDLRQSERVGRVSPEIVTLAVDLANSTKGWLTDNAGTLVGSVATMGTVLLFGAFTTFYLLVNDEDWWSWMTQGLGEDSRAKTRQIVEGVAKRLGAYLRTVTVHALTDALVVFVLLGVFGVPLALGLATLTFAASFIPYLGTLVSLGAIALSALASIGATGTLVLLLLIIVANLVLRRFVTSRLSDGDVRVSPAVVLLALPIGGYVASLFGLIVAVPLAVALLTAASQVMLLLPPSDTEPDIAPPLVPRWLDLLAGWSWRLLAGLAVAAVAFFALVQIPMLGLPLVLAAVLAPTLAPLVGALVNRGWTRSRASGVVTVVVTAVIGILAVLAIVVLTANAGDVSSGANDGAAAVNDAAGGLGGLVTDATDEISSNIVDTVVSVGTAIAALTAIVVMGVILTFVALKDGRRTWETLTSRLEPWRKREIDAAAERAASVLGSYMLGTGAVSLFGAGTQWLLMVVLGIPLALPVFVLSFFGGYIPYIGSALTTLIADLLAISTGEPLVFIVFIVFTLIFNVVQGNIVQPLVFSRAVNIHPAVVLLAIPAGGALGGILGMFLIVPILGVVATTWRTVLVVMGQPPTVVAEGGETTRRSS